MDNKELREKFEKEFWSEHDDDLTPLEFSSKWWLEQMTAQRERIEIQIKQRRSVIMTEYDKGWENALDIVLQIIEKVLNPKE